MPDTPQPGQAGVVTATREQICAAFRDELIYHFAWTSVQGLVELEARQIAWNAFRRLRDGLKGQPPESGETIRRLFVATPRPDQRRILRDLSLILDPIPAPRAGKVMSAVIQVLLGRQAWSLAELKTELAALGVQATPKEVANALGYLTRKGKIQSAGYGQYFVEVARR